MSFPAVNFQAIQHRKVLENLRANQASLLTEKEMASILKPKAFARYERLADDASAELERAEHTAATATPEGQAFWDAALTFWKESFSVWKMGEANKTQREAKLAAERALRAKHEAKLGQLWAAVPDKGSFRRANVHETLDVGSVLGLKAVPAREREKRDRAQLTAIKKAKRSGKPKPSPLVLNYEFFLAKSVAETNDDIAFGVWRVQVEALERHLGLAAVAVEAEISGSGQFLGWAQ